MIFLVLGMHKSGTTLVAQTLHRSGISMGWDITDEHFAYRGNHCESPLVNLINDRLLTSEGLLSSDILSGIASPASEDILHDLEEYINRQSQNSKDWGIKDPRMCLTYPVWADQIPQHKLLVIFRTPCEVNLHYLQKSPRRKMLTQFWKSFRVWSVYNKAILEILETKDVNDYIVFEYGQLMQSDQLFARLENFVGVELADLRDPQQYHQKLTDKVVFSKLCRFVFFLNVFGVKRIWTQLQRLAESA